MNTTNANAVKQNRILWMDNLRTVIIALVVLYHVGGVYEAAGLWGWFWIVDDPTTITWVGIVGIVFDIFMMATLFFLSGYLAQASLKNKSAWEFVKGKFKRLMIPWALAVFTLIPLYKAIFLYSRGLPQENWTTYFHLTNPNSQNWLWFLPLLFLFDLLFLGLSKLNVKLPKISMAWAVAGATVIGLVTSFFIGSWLGFRSWTLTPLLDFENERVLMYFMAFLLGVMAYTQNVFADQPKSKTAYIIASSIAWIPVTGHIFARIYPFFFPQGFEITPLYRLIWHASFYLSLVVMVYVMVESFRLYITKPGSLWKALNRNSYGVYIIHVIMIGIFGTLLLNTGLPALVKYPLLVITAYVVSNLLVSGYRGLRNMLTASRVKPAAAVDVG
ncbi:MAG: acyltransferase [Anaerolineales bacterium]|jgi:peptidoglycan/LPS O-acetylase OafA/YrhL